MKKAVQVREKAVKGKKKKKKSFIGSLVCLNSSEKLLWVRSEGEEHFK